MTKKLNISYLKSGGLITNYYCSSSCSHCLYRCCPKWPEKYIDHKTALRNLEIIKLLGCDSIHIGGGESFLNIPELIKVVDQINKMSINIEYIETNSSWFKNSKSAEETLCILLDHGVKNLLISISPFHNEFVPFVKVKNLINSCYKTGMHPFFWIPDFLPEICSLDNSRVHSLEEYEKLFGTEYISQALDRYMICPGGRAQNLFSKYRKRHTINRIFAAESNSRCTELSRTDHFHLDLFGNFIPGLCSGLSIEVNDLGKQLSPDKYPIISSLYSHGIKGFFYYAMEEYGYVANKPSYSSKCELCFEIRKFLVAEAKISSKELLPLEFYFS